jgi:oxygen-independent coproporphyrinogen-3 oxidase
VSRPENHNLVVHPATAPSAAPDRGRGVYVHVPFCRRRCPYCDFQIEVGKSQRGYLEALLREWQARGAGWHRLQSLSLGGGTPSSLPTHDLGQIAEALRERLLPGAEVSLEVNPEDVDGAFADGLKKAGFTRVSVGLQSFADDVLDYLGRAHDGAGASAAIGSLLDTGIDVGVDLIVGVPGEADDRLQRDIERARTLGVAHLSAYLLTVEPGTPLVQLIAQRKRAAVDDDAQAAAYERVQGLCRAAGYQQYEVSSYALPGKSSRHNRLYWQRGDYLGLGPGAHGFVVGASGSAVHTHNAVRLAQWLTDPTAPAEVEELPPPHALREAVAFGLRDQLAGVDVEALAALHQTPPQPGIAAALDAAIDAGDVVVVGSRHHLTDRGLRFADRVARDVLEQPADS